MLSVMSHFKGWCSAASVNGHLGCFHVLTTVNSASVNIGVHVSFQIMVFYRYVGLGFSYVPCSFPPHAISSAPDSCPKIFHCSLNLYSCFAPNTNWISVKPFFWNPWSRMYFITDNFLQLCSSVFCPKGVVAFCCPRSFMDQPLAKMSAVVCSTWTCWTWTCDRCVYPAQPSVSLFGCRISAWKASDFRSHCRVILLRTQIYCD